MGPHNLLCCFLGLAACDGLALRPRPATRDDVALRPRPATRLFVAPAAVDAPLPADAPACVVVPGFLYGAEDFLDLAVALRSRGIAATVAPIAWWHWLPCLGGRSVRPILERIDAAVEYATTAETVALAAPAPAYGPSDLLGDVRDTPGGVLRVGGSADPDEFPTVAPDRKSVV